MGKDGLALSVLAKFCNLLLNAVLEIENFISIYRFLIYCMVTPHWARQPKVDLHNMGFISTKILKSPLLAKKKIEKFSFQNKITIFALQKGDAIPDLIGHRPPI
jgi:hypothetical protein